METPQRRPRTIEKDRKDRDTAVSRATFSLSMRITQDDCDRLDRKISIGKTETIAKDRKCFNGNHFRATGRIQETETTQKYPTMHRTFPTVFQNWLRQQDCL